MLRLRQVLVNLVANAVKCTTVGSVKVTVRCDDNDCDRLSFTVEDTGRGMSAATLAHIFDAFAQGDEEASRHSGGTGLGLTIARELVALMHGKIDAESQLGVGSRFWFTAEFGKVSDEQQAASQPFSSEPARVAQCAGAEILVVEDNGVNRAVIEAMTAATAASCLAGARRGSGTRDARTTYL